MQLLPSRATYCTTNVPLHASPISNFLCRLITRLIVGLSFDSNFRNRPNLTILTLEIDLKLDSISIILKSIQLDLTRFSISILEIESNR
jgi:hypothetical protein